MNSTIKQRIEQIKSGIVPQGYKKTKNGIVPKEWNMKKLSDVLQKQTQKNTENLIHNVLTNSALQGIISQSEYFDKQIANDDNTNGYYIVRQGYFVYNPRISINAPCGPFNKYYGEEDGVMSPLYAVYKYIDGSSYYSDYLAYFFMSASWYGYMNSIANYGARNDRMNVTSEDMNRMPLPYPPLPEQAKIAKILQTQDKVIELKEKLLEEKKRQKKYLMQQLLTGKKRLPGFSGEWKRVKLGDICYTFSGGTPKRTNTEYYDGDIPWIKSGELNQENIYETEEKITQQGLENSSAKIVEENTLLIAMYGATAGVIAFSRTRAAINQAILAIVPKDDVNTNFLKNAISNQIYIATKKLTQGGQPNFNASIIESFIISVPLRNEQEAIANILAKADEEINLLQKDIEQEKQKKKALMQLLLTGIVRV